MGFWLRMKDARPHWLVGHRDSVHTKPHPTRLTKAVGRELAGRLWVPHCVIYWGHPNGRGYGIRTPSLDEFEPATLRR